MQKMNIEYRTKNIQHRIKKSGSAASRTATRRRRRSFLKKNHHKDTKTRRKERKKQPPASAGSTSFPLCLCGVMFPLLIAPTLRVGAEQTDALRPPTRERRKNRSHAERGNDYMSLFISHAQKKTIVHGTRVNRLCRK